MERRDLYRATLAEVIRRRSGSRAGHSGREGDCTLFDNTMVMDFPENGETHHGIGLESPFVILSGRNCNRDIAGRSIRLPVLGVEGHKTLGN